MFCIFLSLKHNVKISLVSLCTQIIGLNEALEVGVPGVPYP